MKKEKTTGMPTTISANPGDRDILKAMASELGVSQRKCLGMILGEKVRRDKLERRLGQPEFVKQDVSEMMKLVNRHLEMMAKMEKPMDTTVTDKD